MEKEIKTKVWVMSARMREECRGKDVITEDGEEMEAQVQSQLRGQECYSWVTLQKQGNST